MFYRKLKKKKKLCHGSCNPQPTDRFGYLDPNDEPLFKKTFIFEIKVGFWINDAQKGPH